MQDREAGVGQGGRKLASLAGATERRAPSKGVRGSAPEPGHTCTMYARTCSWQGAQVRLLEQSRSSEKRWEYLALVSKQSVLLLSEHPFGCDALFDKTL